MAFASRLPRGKAARTPGALALALLCLGVREGAGQCASPRGDRLAVMAGAYAAGETIALVARHGDWWPDSTRAFNFTFGGSPSGNQDGFLHASIAYQTAQVATLAFDWACVSPRTAGWLGTITGIAVSLPKEIGDGFHGTGFSGSDMLFTAAGAVLPGLHRAAPMTRAVALKVNYWPSLELRHRAPGGQPHLEDDYAGQHYFLAIDPGLAGDTGAWPPWLGVAVGHGIPQWLTAPPSSDWYVGLDVNLRGLPVRAPWWHRVATLLDQLHVPLPGIRLRNGGVTLGLY